MVRMLPSVAVPKFATTLADGSPWSLAEERISQFVILVIFRYSECSLCNAYLQQLDGLVDDFAAAGVEVLAASVDDQTRTNGMIDRLGLQNLSVGCGLQLEIASQWGLFVSASRKESEPERFFEPGLFLIDRSGILFYTSVQSMPFGRVSLPDLLEWVPKLIANQIKSRGEVKTS